MASAAPAVDTGQPPGVGPPPPAPQESAESSRQSSQTSTAAATDSPQGDPKGAEFVTPTTNDVFANTEPSQSPTSPRSRKFDESGDAEMDGDEAPAPTTKIDSSLQARLADHTQDQTTDATSSTATRPTTPTAQPNAATSPPADAGAKPRRHVARRSSRRTAEKATPSATTTHPVWSPQGAAYIRATLSQSGAAPTHAPAVPARDDPYRAHYDCALAAASLRRDGDQRAMTRMETDTLHLWIERKIHLATPPLFLRETHTGTERDALADYHRDHLGFRLYVVLPMGIVLSEANAKYDFCFTALLSAQSQTEHDRLLQLYRDAQTTLCEPRSRIATLRFVTPELRDSWNGYSFRFGKEQVTLTATDSLTTDAPRAGFDAGAQQLLYHVFLRGNHRLSHNDVRAIGTAAARTSVLDVTLVESFAASDYSPPKWKLTFDQIACPTAIERMRRLVVQYGDAEMTFLVIHPRATRRSPCSQCLSVRHAVKDCATKDPTTYLARHTLALTVDKVKPVPKITASPPNGNLSELLSSLRQHAAPDVAKRLAAEARTQVEAADRAAKKAAHALRQQTQLQQARRKLAQQTRTAVAKQLHALRLEYHQEDVSPQLTKPTGTAARDKSTAATTPAETTTRADPDAPVMPTCPNKEAPGVDTNSDPVTDTGEETVQPAGSNSIAPSGEEEMEVDDVADSAAATLSIQAHGLQSSPAAANVSTTSPVSGDPAQAGAKAPISAAAAANSTSVPALAPEHSDGSFSPPSSSLALSSRISSGTDTPSISDVASVDRRSLVVLQSRQLSTAASHGKRLSNPVCTTSDEEFGVGHVPKWSRVTTRADDAYDAAKALIPVYPSPLFPNSWSPLLLKAPLALSGPDFQESAANVLDNKSTRSLKQLALSAFYGPRSLAEAQASLEAEMLARRSQPAVDWQTAFPSPALDGLLTALRTPLTVQDWTTALPARVVSTPGTGGCLYFALHGARTRRLTGATMSICNFHVKEGKFYKDAVCDMLDKYLEPMLAAGTIAIADFQRRFNAPLPAARDAALQQIRQYIADVRATSVAKMAPLQWGGDEELFAAVWFVREPIFILAVDAQRQTSMRVIWLDRPLPTGPEEIHHHLPTPGESFELFRVLLRHRVTPMVLVHADSHFNCLRFDERFYKEWTGDDTSGATMRTRLDQALAALGWYVAPLVTDGVPLQQLSPLSGSLYQPSESISGDTPDPATDVPLSPVSHYALLSALNPRRRRRGPLALLWAQAERLNFSAYLSWNAEQVSQIPPASSVDLASACRGWSARPDALLALLRTLPYPEVAISLLPADIVLRLGNELAALDADRALPDFVVADDSADAAHLWSKLLVLVIVGADADVPPLASIQWLRCHPQNTLAALHAIRLYDWTIIADLARECASLSHPNRPDAQASGADRL